MRKIVYFLLLFFEISLAQTVIIPDVNFKSKLIATGVDINSDNEIQETEAQIVTSLDVSNSNIADLTGIESFINLQVLDCSFNQLSTLNVSTLIGLELFNCSNNNITSLNISNIINLQAFSCSDNLLLALDLSIHTNLIEIRAQNNQLTSLDATGLLNLGVLWCFNNDITSINLTGCNALTSFDCSDNQIANSINLGGILTLTELICNNNNIPSINVSGCTNLNNLRFLGNPTFTSLLASGCSTLTNLIEYSPSIQNLDISNCSLMTQLALTASNLQSLNVTGCSGLSQIFVSDSSLTAIDVSNLTSLTALLFDNNLVTTLNVSNCTNLSIIQCVNNLLTSVDVSDLVNLTEFVCSFNSITTLDFSTNKNLNFITLDNNPLETLFVKNGVNETVNFNVIPLTYICTDDNQVATLKAQLTTLGMINTTVNTYCTFTPSGDYNTLIGSFRNDLTNDGCDITDNTLSNIRLDLNDGLNLGATFSESFGNYKFYTQAGNFDVTPNIENPTWFTVSPATVTIPFVNNNNNIVQQDFCITANGVHPDIEIVVAPLNTALSNTNAEYLISYKNKGNQTISGNLNFNYEESDLDYVSSTLAPDSQSAGLLSWNYTNLLPFESRSIKVFMNVNAIVGIELDYSVQINPTIGDELSSDNSFVYKQTVVDSQELNFIDCLQGNSVDALQIGEYLHYIINFDNIGTTTATNVVVKIEIDPAKFDINTLQLLNSSTNTYTRIKDNKVEFIFQNLNIDTGGHGNVLLKIKSNETLLANDLVSIEAEIFFDYSQPLVTRVETTSFLYNPIFVFDDSIVIYPNPTNNKINIKSLTNNSIKSIALYDIQGRLLQLKLLNETEVILDLTERIDGVYFMKVTTEKGSKVERIVKN